MTTRALAAGLLALFCLSAAQAAPRPAAKNKPAPPLALGMSAGGVTINLPDPKLPGRPLCEVQAASAAGQSADNGFLGTMTQVSARLYQNGRPAATLAAPRAQGSSAKAGVVVTATGGVLVRSLLHPGTFLHADTVVWHAGRNQIVATGHVFFKDGKTHATMTGARAVADTAMQTLQIGSVHARAHF